MSRAIKIFGIGFSDTDNDAEVEIKIDDGVIYSGIVATDINFELNEYLLGSELDPTEVASWVEDDAASTKSLSIKAVSGNFLYQAAASTYIDDENATNLTLDELQTLFSYTDKDGDEVYDPNSNVLVDGEEYSGGIPSDRTDNYGQWSIGIPEGSTMTCTLNIGEGVTKPEETTEEATV